MALIACLLLTFPFPGCNRQSPDSATRSAVPPADQFLSLMNAGGNFLGQGDPTNALALYRKAEAISPNDLDLRLNLANCHLLAGSPREAIREADEALKLDPNSAAAYFVKGSAHLRLSQAEEAVKAFENALRIDPGETAACFQLGKARMELRQWDAAISAFKEGIALDPNHLHRAAHYLLGQSLLRAGRPDEARQVLEQFQATPEAGGPSAAISPFEKSKHTQPRVPFRLAQPEGEGVKVVFVDATREVLGDSARTCSGPIGVIDVQHTGWNSLFVQEPGRGFRLLWNTNGVFRPAATAFPARADARYGVTLVGDLQNDRFEDLIVLGDQGSHVFQLSTNGGITDVSSASGLGNLRATDGALLDLDFTGKLDLVAVTAGAAGQLRVYRQFGPLLFHDITSTSGIPASLSQAASATLEDWNRDGNLDLVASRRDGPPILLEKQRGGPLLPRDLTNWLAGTVFCTGDFDCDLRPDLAMAHQGAIRLYFNGGATRELVFPAAAACRQLRAVDYDNDGWLDLCAVGDGIRAWRNLGLAGFQDQTAALGLDSLNGGHICDIRFADFDLDCDSDAVIALADGGLRYLRNDGANANSQVKLHLFGNRSNASGIGCKVEIETGGLRVFRTVKQLPVEVGVGKHQRLDSFLVHWLNWPQGSADVPFNCKEPILALELTLQEGSCPYLYAWDGNRFRFVTDILAASPLGLPISGGRFTEADPEEFVWIGGEETFPASEGGYQVRITEELREVLYLDEAKLVVVDRDPGVEVHPTDKLLPGRPFPTGTLMTLREEHPLRRAETLEGREVTGLLKRVDGRRVSPPRLRGPQLRGLAEPHGLLLDFGALDVTRPLVLALNGWLRFGGGQANIAASHDPALPFPFPALEAEVTPGDWKRVDVVVGAPAGKTKTILVDLSGKLPPGASRLRLSQAFEIHWDRIALMEKQTDPRTRISFIAPTTTDLHFRGFSPLEDLPADCPLTPDYSRVSPNSYWTILPGGWCTRYGDVSALVATRDEALALVHAGDELSLSFATNSLPPKPPGTAREFFLYLDGWDKDADFHVAAGTQVEPLPFHGQNDQLYGRQPRPPFPSDPLHRQFNTRWVEGNALRQAAR